MAWSGDQAPQRKPQLLLIVLSISLFTSPDSGKIPVEALFRSTSFLMQHVPLAAKAFSVGPDPLVRLFPWKLQAHRNQAI
jgi:hypothetical protein